MRRSEEGIRDAAEALSLLKEGNRRFVRNELSGKGDYPKLRTILQNGQKPYAVVFCCSDSRVSPEIFFDQKLGDLFVIRNAGNVVDDVTLGSIEYACEHLGSPLVVVVGHTSCGAVTAALSHEELPGKIAVLAKKIVPSVGSETSVNKAAAAHAKKMAQKIAGDEILKHLHTRVIAAIYDIVSGEVAWL